MPAINISVSNPVVLALICILYPLCLIFLLSIDILSHIFKTKKVKNIKDEVAVVTGAATGLGKEIAIELAKQGCHIAIVDVNIALAEKTATYIQDSFNVKARAYKTDVTSYQQIEELNINVTKDLGITTILVNNAGLMLFNDLFNPNWQEVQRMINVNLTAHFFTIGVFLPKMEQLNKGHIVAVSSIAGLTPVTRLTEYVSTKFAVRGLMRSLRQNFKLCKEHKNIHTTIVYPYFMSTNPEVDKIATFLGFRKLLGTFVSGQQVAQRAVSAILEQQEEIVVPDSFGVLYYLLKLTPVAWHDTIFALLSNDIVDKYEELKQGKTNLMKSKNKQ